MNIKKKNIDGMHSKEYGWRCFMSNAHEFDKFETDWARKDTFKKFRRKD